MAREKWNILSNMFEVKTRGSFKKAFVFSERHFNFLKGGSANPDIAPIYNSFGPVHLDFSNAYVRWTLAKGHQKAAAQDLNKTLLSINQKLKQWEPQVYSLYPEDSSDGKAIFPHKRTPFYKGSDIARCEQVLVLAGQLQNYPALSALRTDVMNFYNLLESKVRARHGAEGAVFEQSNKLEQKRKKVCAEMYGNLGWLMHVYRHDLKRIDPYFDMGVIKNKVRRKKKGEQEE